MSYYDIDEILAEEELMPCTNLFDFSHLSHLDPDLRSGDHHLPDGSKIKIPLWAMEKWSKLGFVRMSLPKHFNKKNRERLEADPADADLRKKNEHFFMTGCKVVGLIERCASAINDSIANTSNRRAARSNASAMNRLMEEVDELRQTLLVTYTGERLRRTLDWAVSSVGDDVTCYTKKLTELELQLFLACASATAAHSDWKMFGARQLLVYATASSKRRPVTPDPAEKPAGKRQRKE